jgi:hypothetical protein
MSDDTTNRGNADRKRIDVSQRHELRYWTERFGVSEEKLIETVRRVGPMAEDVKRSLGSA